jgi:DNA-binding NarL/FixJ family response regulator
LVVGIAKTGIECLSLISKTKSDVVLLDIKLPDGCGTDFIDKIKKVQPEVKIIMMTGHGPKGYVSLAISKGADGFLLKDCSVEELIEGILRVNDGGVYFSQGVEAFLQPRNNSDNVYFPFKSEKTLSGLLTTREIEIIELVSRGLHNKEIASVLGIKVRTANYHISNILLKLDVNTRLEAVLQWAKVDKEILYWRQNKLVGENMLLTDK